MLRVQSVPVFVSDIDRAIAFYRDQLGFHVLVDAEMQGGFRWVMVTPEPGGTELILYRPMPAMNGEQTDELEQRIGTWTGIILLTDNIQQTYGELGQRGIVFEAEPQMQPWGVFETWFSDPDGNRFHLVQRLDQTFDQQPETTESVGRS